MTRSPRPSTPPRRSWAGQLDTEKVTGLVNAAKEKLGDLANNEKVADAVNQAKEKLGDLTDNGCRGRRAAKGQLGELKDKLTGGDK